MLIDINFFSNYNLDFLLKNFKTFKQKLELTEIKSNYF